jgi:hypothetical protein
MVFQTFNNVADHFPNMRRASEKYHSKRLVNISNESINWITNKIGAPAVHVVSQMLFQISNIMKLKSFK